MRVIIAGGGIGGLAAGLMLHARGIACDVFEQGSEIRELGVGINTLPHAIKELAEIGLLERLDHVGIRTLRAHLREPLRPGDLARAARHRCGLSLSAILDPSRTAAESVHQALRARIGDTHIHTGCRLGAGVRTRAVSRVISSTAKAPMCIPRPGMCWSARTAFIRRFVRCSLRRGAAGLERHHAVARRARLAAIPRRSLDDRRRRDEREARALSDRPRRAATRGSPIGRSRGKSAKAASPPRKEDWSRPGRLEELLPHVRASPFPASMWRI